MPATITIPVTDGFGATATASTTAIASASLPDGASGAVPGPAQYPSLLGGLAARAAWNVAGVDYAVGPHVPARYKVPSAIGGTDALPSGVTYSPWTFKVTIAGTVLDGYDFGSHALEIAAPNCAVRNCRITGQDLAITVDQSATNTLIEYNYFNGRLTGPGPNILNVSGFPFTLQYNWFDTASSDFIDFDKGGGQYIVQYNVFNNNAQGNSSIHGDWITHLGGQFDSKIVFNTFIQTTFGTLGSSGTQGIVIGSNPGITNFTSCEVGNNTIVGPCGPSFVFLFYNGMMNCTPNIHDNYVDVRGINFSSGYSVFGFNNSAGPYPGLPSATNNVSMNTGVSHNGTGSDHLTW